jgi:Ca2+-binding EF-hand superfamily protein
LGLTTVQNFELIEAFKVIAGEGQSTIPEDKISDLFDAIGYTLQESDITWIINNTTAQKDGTYICDMLAESFSDWKKEQMNIDDIKAVFNMLASGKKFTMEFPTTFTGEPGSNTIKADAIKFILTETVKRNLPYTVDDVERIIDEISTGKDKGIQFKDFVGLFTK